MRYEIKYQPSFSLAIVYLERGEQVMAESGAMVSMSPTIQLDAKMSGGGMMGPPGMQQGGYESVDPNRKATVRFDEDTHRSKLSAVD